MAVRLSGLVSNMDTESIIKEMMSAQSGKKTKLQNKVTKNQWEQDKWKDLNKKIYALYTDELSKFKTQSSYLTKSVTSNDSTKGSFTAASLVPAGTHKVEISSLASAQFITGDKVTVEGMDAGLDKNGEEITVGTKLTELGVDNNTIFTLTMGDGKTSRYMVSDKTTIKDFNNFCKEAGVNASYDTSQNRFFLSSVNSGKENTFELTSTSVGENDNQITADRINTMKENVGYHYLSSDQRKIVDSAIHTMASSKSITSDEYKAAEQTLHNYADAHEKGMKVVYASEAYDKNVKSNFKEEFGEKYEESMLIKEADGSYKLADGYNTEENEEILNSAINKAKSAGTKSTEYVTEFSTKLKENESATTPVRSAELSNTLAGVSQGASGSEALNILGIGELTKSGDSIVSSLPSSSPSTSKREVFIVQGSDCKIMYNDAEFVSKSNTITINGLTINATGITEKEKPLTVTVSNDTSSVSNMVKGFVKKYNDVVKEMNSAYYADTAKGYNVLTDEEREQMTDDQIEKWENKIKDSLLRRDDTLYSVMSAMKGIVSIPVEVDGKTYRLSDFGIGTSSDYTEKGLLHINGDKDDSQVANMTNKLEEAINNNPDLVMKVFTGIGNQLYSTMSDKMKSTPLSSALTFYNDKELVETKKTYEKEVKKMEKRLKEIEDRYYKKFSAMETALSKLNSQTSYFSSMLGTS